MKRAVHAVGADLGGTWLRVCAADDRGRVLKSVKAPSPGRKGLVRFLRQTWRRWGVHRPAHITIGARGVWLPAERRKLAAELRGLAETVTVLSDVELAFESALTPRNRRPGKAAGILILAGTGSIALGRNRRGLAARAGGLGPGRGDEGSGYWIGREYLRQKEKSTFRKYVKPLLNNGSNSVIASRASRVLRNAHRDPSCRAIRSRAQCHLADLVVYLANKLCFKGAVPVAWAGGLFRNRAFRLGFFRTLKETAPALRVRPSPPMNAPARAAALWAGRLQGLPSSFFRTR